MSKSQETFNKKEKEKKRLKKKKDKEQKKEERKSNSDKGKSLEEMYAYVDSNGNISDTPPDPNEVVIHNMEDIRIGIARQEDIVMVNVVRTGIVNFFKDEKGYGFIKDINNGESIFVHINGLETPIKEDNKVSFETEMGKKGLNAIKVKLTE